MTRWLLVKVALELGEGDIDLVHDCVCVSEGGMGTIATPRYASLGALEVNMAVTVNGAIASNLYIELPEALSPTK